MDQTFTISWYYLCLIFYRFNRVMVIINITIEIGLKVNDYCYTTIEKPYSLGFLSICSLQEKR